MLFPYTIAQLVCCAASGGLHAAQVDEVHEQKPSSSNATVEQAPTTSENSQAAQTDPNLPAPPPASNDDEIVVIGSVERGSVIGRIPPERTFSPLEINTFGATDIGTLIQRLGPLATSIRGGEESAPIVLLNGRRISSVADIARIPSEAIERMEVFPEALALAYGFRPDQKVVNIVVFERFSQRTTEMNLGVPTEGGLADRQFSASLLRIRNDTRFNFDTSYRMTGALLESERALLEDELSLGAREARTLLPENERLALNGTLTKALSAGLSATLNTRLTTETNAFLLGLQFNEPLSREVDSDKYHVGIALNGQRNKWIWSLTANVDRTETKVTTEIDSMPLPEDQTASSNTFAEAELVLSGPLIALPAGQATVSLRAGFGALDFIGASILNGAKQQTKLGRDRVAVQASLDVPIINSRTGLAWMGALSANANVTIEELSDVGVLEAYGIGLSWSPVEAFTVYGSYNKKVRAPAVEELGAPQITTRSLRVFDFSQEQTVDVTQVFGGNPLLRLEGRREFSLGVYIKPFPATDFRLSADYLDTHIESPISVLPAENTSFEVVFPERFIRDAAGQLLRIDARPLNFSSAKQRTLRSGISFTKQLTKSPPLPEGIEFEKVEVFPSEAAMRASLPPGTVVVEAAPGSADAQRIENLSSRFTVALYHTLRVTNEITPQMDGPTFDLLDGFATDLRGLSPRHQLSFQAGFFQSWFGARLTADWRSKTTTRSLSSASMSTDRGYTTSDYTTVDVSLFANPAERLGGTNAPGWIKGTRVTLSITNLFNTRPRVADDNGMTPFAYQPVYLDPLGRTLSLSLRKIF